MQDYFYTLADFIDKQLQNNEITLCELTAEQSDFIRFNKGHIRQPGSVEQRYLEIDLIKDKRRATGELALSGDTRTDYERIGTLLSELREQLSQIPDDPYLLYATDVQSTESIGTNQLPAAEDALTEISSATQGHDFVGIYAAGGIFTGFANSLGQRNWHSNYSFNLDWSIYHNKDKAVKSAYAGFNWEPPTFQEKVTESLTQLTLLKRKPHTAKPGKYRVYLSPNALYEILQLLSWNGFGLKAQRTKETALLRMLETPAQQLHPSITLTENTAQGIAPAFQSEGFIKPAQIPLISKGVYDTALISPRSAKEYSTNTNGANDDETPQSFDLAAGDFAVADILKTLEKGIYINNLWYLNYSDRAACRMTGMTRFATFWVENGEFTIEGYKSFAQSTKIELAPLTIIFGKNDSGKSSLCRVPLFLTHLFQEKAITPFPLELSGIDFGRTLKEICYGERLQGFTGSLILENAPFKVVELGGTELREKEHRQLVTRFNVISSENTIEIENEENFENLKQLINKKLKPLKTLPDSISFVGGMRQRPQRAYRFPSGIRPDVEPDGSHAPHWLFLSKQRDQKLLRAVSRWFQEYVGLEILIEQNAWGFEIQAKYPWQHIINMADTGEGIGQVLPIVTTLLSLATKDAEASHEKSLLILEQPELHLHPFAHTGIAELLVAAMDTNRSILVETHSDTLLLRIRRAIAEQRIPHTLVRFYYVEKNKEGRSISKAIELNDRGTPSWWPRGIFSEDQEEYQAIRRALSQR